MINRTVGWLFVSACAAPLSTHVCVNKTGKTDVSMLAAKVVDAMPRDGTFSVQVINHAPQLHDSAPLLTSLRGALAGKGVVLRDEAECERFLRVTLEKRQLYVEVVERNTRRVPYVHEYALDFCD